MALILRGENYWMDVQINGKRLRESLKTGDKKLAQQLHDMRKAELWREGVLKEKPKKTFKEACARWVIERSHKRSLPDDQLKIKFLLPKIGGVLLSELTRDKIESVLPKEVAGATRNRYRALIRAMLRAAEREWDWLDRAPVLRTEAEPKRRVAYLTREQAEVLITCLPEKYRMPVRFALLTGLRRSNVFGLTWEAVDLDNSMVHVAAEDAKAGQRILVPLNKSAKALLEFFPEPRKGRVWGDMDRVWANTWTAACKRAGVPGFRFHDLRHTWASWHAMAGTPLSVLQELGGWHSHEMVQRYAHLSPEHLANAAERVNF
jgi:integrase